MAIPSIDAKIYTLSAFFVGYYLISEESPAEQSSLGNWFMLVGQALCTNSSQQQVLNNRSNNNTGNNIQNSSIGDKRATNRNNANDEINNEINRLNKIIAAMQKEIDYLKTKL